MVGGTMGSTNLHRAASSTSDLYHAELKETLWRNARLELDLVDTQVTEHNTILKKILTFLREHQECSSHIVHVRMTEKKIGLDWTNAGRSCQIVFHAFMHHTGKCLQGGLTKRPFGMITRDRRRSRLESSLTDRVKCWRFLHFEPFPASEKIIFVRIAHGNLGVTG